MSLLWLRTTFFTTLSTDGSKLFKEFNFSSAIVCSRTSFVNNSPAKQYHAETNSGFFALFTEGKLSQVAVCDPVHGLCKLPGTLSSGTGLSFVTLTTVGYGDISPATTGGRIIAIIIMFFGIGLLGMLSGNLATIMISKRIRENKGMGTTNLEGHIKKPTAGSITIS